MLQLLSAGVALGDWPFPPENIQEHVIPVDGQDSAAEVVRLDIATTVSRPQVPDQKTVRELATKGRGYEMCGDLFKTGGFFVLYEPKIGGKPGSPTLALAEDVEWKLNLRGLWKMPIEWIPQDKQWSGPENQFESTNSIHKPFHLEDVIGDETPEVIVAGEKGKYHQASYVMKYDKDSHGLNLLTYSMSDPTKVGEYLRIYRASGNKATWQEWTFFEWKDGKLAERAMWHSEIAYNKDDSSFFAARATDKTGKIENFRINMSNMWRYEILKDGEPFAKVRTKWLPDKSHENEELMQQAWLFEKLTGLPRESFPARYGKDTKDKPRLARLEEFAEVEVDIAGGNEAARERFPEKTKE